MKPHGLCIGIASAVFVTLIGCSDPTTPVQEGAAPPVVATPGIPPRIDSVVPGGTRAGVVFNRQPNGAAAFSVTGAGFAPAAAVTANGQKLDTTFGNEGWVTAVMPAGMYAQPGRIAIQIVNPGGATSNAVDFEVMP